MAGTVAGIVAGTAAGTVAGTAALVSGCQVLHEYTQDQAPVELVTVQFNIQKSVYSIGMKTTLDLNDQLLANAKALAAQQRTSLTRLIEEALHLRLRASNVEPPNVRKRLPFFHGRGGMVAGIDPLSNKAMSVALDDDA